MRWRWAASGAEAAGSWLIDDVSLCQPVGKSGILGFQSTAYPCQGSATLLLADGDLTGAGRAVVEVMGPTLEEPLAVELMEESPGSFQGRLELVEAPAPGRLLARDGDVLTATYRDASDQDGAPQVVQATALVDCRPPEITSVRFGLVSFDQVEVLWETSEATRGGLLYGGDCAALKARATSGLLGAAHGAALEGVKLGIPAFFRILAADLAGNAASQPAAPDCGSFSLAMTCHFEDALEPPVEGWSHGAALGVDDWQLVEFSHARSPTRSFHAGNDGRAKDAYLVMPPMTVPPAAMLSFWHSFEFTDGFDGALLEISVDGGAAWTNLGPAIREGQYGGAIETLAGPIAGWTGGQVGPMSLVRVALDDYAGPERRIRFRVLCDSSVGSGGWFIDDVSLCTFTTAPAPGGTRFARGNCNADPVLNLSDAIFLLNYLFLGGEGPSCLSACDADQSGLLNITDGIYLLNYLFLGGLPLPPPELCAASPAPDPLGCASEACASP